MESLLGNDLSLSQWIQLFILAMAVITVSSFVTMFSIWIMTSKLTDIKRLLEEEKQSQNETEENETR